MLSISVVLFSVTSMLSVAFQYTFAHLVDPLRDVEQVGRALAANFVFVPSFAFLLANALALDDSYAMGLYLLGTAGGAPFLIKLTVAAGGPLVIAATLLLVLVPFTIVYMPIVVPLIAPQAEVSLLVVAKPLVFNLLFPLAIGLAIHRHWEKVAAALLPAMRRISSWALVALLFSTLLLNLPGLMRVVGERAILAGVLFAVGSFAIGYLTGGRGRDIRVVHGLGAGQRSVAATTIVAVQSFTDRDILVMVVVASLTGLVVLFAIAKIMRRAVE